MTFNLEISSMYSTKTEERLVKFSKYKLIDTLNCSNIQHSIVKFISNTLNKAIKNLNSDKKIHISFSNIIKPTHFDLIESSKYISLFKESLRKSLISKPLLEYFYSFSDALLSYLDSLIKNSFLNN